MKKSANYANEGRQLAVGALGVIPGGLLGALASAGISSFAKKNGKPLDSHNDALLRTVGTTGGAALGGLAAQLIDGQYNTNKWDYWGRKRNGYDLGHAYVDFNKDTEGLSNKEKEDLLGLIATINDIMTDETDYGKEYTNTHQSKKSMSKKASRKVTVLVPGLVKIAGFVGSDAGNEAPPTNTSVKHILQNIGAHTAGAGAGLALGFPTMLGAGIGAEKLLEHTRSKGLHNLSPKSTEFITRLSALAPALATAMLTKDFVTKKLKPKSKKDMTDNATIKTAALVPRLMKQAGFKESDTGKYLDKSLPEVSVQNGAVTAGAGAGAFGAGKLLSKLTPNKLPNVARQMRRGGVLMAGAGAGMAGIGAVKNMLTPEKETPKPALSVPATKDEGSGLMDKVKGSLSDAYDTTKSTVTDAYRATKDTASDVLDLPYAKPALAALAATPILYAILKRRKKKKAAPVEE